MDIFLNWNHLQYLICLLSIFCFSTAIATPARKFPLDILKNNENKWRTLHIELEETSGPVSPEFHYSFKIYIQAIREGFFIYRSESKGDHISEPQRKRITEKEYLQIVTKLLKNNIHLMENEKLPEVRILGVSYNSISYKIGNQKKQFYYLLQDIDKKENKNKKEIIRILKEIKP
ncbi:hypothetical protein [Leptospira sp. GIMC2001]|uniref:hypothetical protein n=1 Tax=Leptospira sp. GIMC2001 TaxID=1513297 RepID=UPI0023491D2C|nr:hypothetical protein [Leptospira sp. GIMC2001]WCL47724.1 hypothetical protein O4O04_00270 [Leptospira sp. GIMC2001]